jgi:glycine dehydrogenase subunit 2
MFIDTLRAITDEAASNPGLLHEAPVNSAVRRLDETAAARNLDLTG